MKTLLSIFCLVVVFTSNAQEWTTVYGTDYDPLGFVNSSGGWRPGNRMFKVSPYDNSIWMASDIFAHGFDSSGNYFRFDHTNEFWFTDNTNYSTILEFEFTPTNTFLVDIYNGVMRYDGNTWFMLEEQDNANFICSDGDSVWVSYQGLDYLTWKAGTLQFGSFTGFERMVSRKGVVWGSTSPQGGLIYRLVNDVPSNYYSPDTSFLLDNSNLDMKFARNSDTLYIAGDSGISLAYNDMFIDTITMGNSVNMPAPSIREIEFDQNDNIWALFGTAWDQHSHIAYYNQSTETWSMIYDNTNSPINWNTRVSIEVDANGNLYVVDGVNLHVLKVNNWPQWLNVPEQEEVSFSIYPNPSSGEISISLPFAEPVDQIKIIDMTGRELLKVDYTEHLNLNLQQGMYMLQLIKGNKVIGSDRILLK